MPRPETIQTSPSTVLNAALPSLKNAIEDGRTGPSMAALWQLQHMAFTPDARSVTPGWLRTCLKDAGFVDIEEEDMIPGLTRLVHARKPD